MRAMMATLTRFMPLMFFIVVVISVAQFIAQHPLNPVDWWHAVVAFLGRYWELWLIIAVLLWAVVLLGLYHERNAPGPKKKEVRSWDRDVLDRLTNRDLLETELRSTAEPTVLDADVLSAQLKSRVIGQAFQRLFHESVLSSDISDVQTLELTFTDGLVLDFFDDSNQFESMQIYLAASAGDSIVI